MRRVTRAGLNLLLPAILLAVSAFNVFSQGKTLNPANQIVLSSQGQQSGQFSAPDLTVNYTYVLTGGNIQLTGTVQFGMTIQANYSTVQTFQLGLALADAQGNVLGQQGLTTSSGNNVGDPINFSKTVPVPAQASSMAFTYTGQAYSSGRGGPDPTNFFFYPFN